MARRKQVHRMADLACGPLLEGAIKAMAIRTVRQSETDLLDWQFQLKISISSDLDSLNLSGSPSVTSISKSAKPVSDSDQPRRLLALLRGNSFVVALADNAIELTPALFLGAESLPFESSPQTQLALSWYC